MSALFIQVQPDLTTDMKISPGQHSMKRTRSYFKDGMLDYKSQCSITSHLASLNVSSMMDLMTEKRVPKLRWTPEHFIQTNKPRFSARK